MQEKLEFHLFELASAKQEVAGRNFVPEGLAYLRDSEWKLFSGEGSYGFEIRENRLRRFRPQVNRLSGDGEGIRRASGAIVIPSLRTGDRGQLLQPPFSLFPNGNEGYGPRAFLARQYVYSIFRPHVGFEHQVERTHFRQVSLALFALELVLFHQACQLLLVQTLDIKLQLVLEQLVSAELRTAFFAFN